MSGPYLHKEVDESQGGDDHGRDRRGQQDDDTGAQNVEERAHEHLDDLRQGGVDDVHLLGEAVDQIPAGGLLEKAHRAPQDVVEQVEVEAAGSKNPPHGNRHGVAKHRHACREEEAKTWT